MAQLLWLVFIIISWVVAYHLGFYFGFEEGKKEPNKELPHYGELPLGVPLVIRDRRLVDSHLCYVKRLYPTDEKEYYLVKIFEDIQLNSPFVVEIYDNAYVILPWKEGGVHTDPVFYQAG